MAKTIDPRAQLQKITEQHDEALEHLQALQADWRGACKSGDDALADQLESQLPAAQRAVERLALRAEQLADDVARLEAREAAERAAALTKTADSKMGEIDALFQKAHSVGLEAQALAAQLEREIGQWRELRHVAREAGGAPRPRPVEFSPEALRGAAAKMAFQHGNLTMGAHA